MKGSEGGSPSPLHCPTRRAGCSAQPGATLAAPRLRVPPGVAPGAGMGRSDPRGRTRVVAEISMPSNHIQASLLTERGEGNYSHEQDFEIGHQGNANRQPEGLCRESAELQVGLCDVQNP